MNCSFLLNNRVGWKNDENLIIIYTAYTVVEISKRTASDMPPASLAPDFFYHPTLLAPEYFPPMIEYIFGT